MESQALTDLLARAGASDQDRAAWLAERRGGCTATEARDMYRPAITARTDAGRTVIAAGS